MKKQIIIFIFLIIALGCSQNDLKDSVIKEIFDPTYQKYSIVLQSYLKSEKVDYSQLKLNRANLDSFINQLAGTTKNQLNKMSQNEQLAFWINAYNGITLRSIIDNYPTKSIQDIKGVWTETKWYVAEQKLTLDFIEHKILRPTYKDARIHFGVNCASIGCPPLFNQPFTGQNVDSLLDLVSSMFVQNIPRHTIDYENKSILTSELFSWFWEDFVTDYNTIKFESSTNIENAILNFTYQHLDDSLKTKFSKDSNWKISFDLYDWSLNDTVSLSDIKPSNGTER